MIKAFHWNEKDGGTERMLMICSACGNHEWLSEEEMNGWTGYLRVILCPKCSEIIGMKYWTGNKEKAQKYVDKIEEMENNAIEQLKTAARERDKLRMYLERVKKNKKRGRD